MKEAMKERLRCFVDRKDLEPWRALELTPVHVVPVDDDVLVAVAARVLVVEAERVQQLVYDDAVLQAAGRPQGHPLPLARPADRGGAAAGRGRPRSCRVCNCFPGKIEVRNREKK